MKKEIILISLCLLVFLVSAFSNTETDYYETEHLTTEISTVPLSTEITPEEIRIPFTGNEFIGFREALAFKESQGNYKIVNTIGYLGKYQFGRTTLERFKIYDTREFLASPKLQEEAFIALCSVNKWILRKDIKRSVGKKINGILITESGILAAAHLSGAGNVKKFLRTNGQSTFKDAFGSSIQHYMRKFAGYDTSIIKSDKNAMV